jgi:hypothetical protein
MPPKPSDRSRFSLPEARIPLGFLLGFCLVFFGGKAFLQRATQAPELRWEQLTLVNPEGESQDFTATAGQTRLVCFWVRGSQPSLDALKALQPYCQSEKLNCYFVTDEPMLVLQSFARQQTAPLPLFRSRKRLFELGLSSVPSLYLLDEEGKVLMGKAGKLRKGSKGLQQLQAFLDSTAEGS